MSSQQNSNTQNSFKLSQLTQEDYKSLYNIGVKKFEIGDFDGAVDVFQLLVAQNKDSLIQGMSTEKVKNYVLYLKALASSFQNLDEYLLAYTYYNGAYLLDAVNNYDCLFYMGFCALKDNKKELAAQHFNEFISKDPEHSLVKKAKLFLQALDF
jgi:tetratricopeptide (TPR) repeat protein